MNGGPHVLSRIALRCEATSPQVALAWVLRDPNVIVIPKAGRKPTEAAIKKYALENAPAYQHPRFVWFTDELPLASTNKVDRSALRKLALERVVARSR